jgi:hypothetical protein
MTSKAIHAAWRRISILWWWMDIQADECSGPRLMCLETWVF